MEKVMKYKIGDIILIKNEKELSKKTKFYIYSFDKGEGNTIGKIVGYGINAYVVKIIKPNTMKGEYDCEDWYYVDEEIKGNTHYE